MKIICTVKSYTTKAGDNFIPILNKDLWIPNLGHRLSNPKHILHNGVEVQDNPYDKYPMVIKSHADNFNACVKSTGTNIHLTTWTPTTDETRKLLHVMLSYSNPYNPNTIRFPNISYSEKRGD